MHCSEEGHKWDAQEAHPQMKDTETQESSTPVPKIQRNQMVQARKTTNLQPHPSPSGTQRNSSIITGPPQFQTSWQISNSHQQPRTTIFASPTTFEDPSLKCNNLNAKPTWKNQKPQTPDPPFP